MFFSALDSYKIHDAAVHPECSSIRASPRASPSIERAFKGWRLKTCFSFDIERYVAARPAYLAVTVQAVCATTYPVNLASQGDF